MAIAFYSSGPVLVNYDGVDLGYTEDRVEITIQPFFDDIAISRRIAGIAALGGAAALRPVDAGAA